MYVSMQITLLEEDETLNRVDAPVKVLLSNDHTSPPLTHVPSLLKGEYMCVNLKVVPPLWSYHNM